MQLQTAQNIQTNLEIAGARRFGFSESEKLFKIISNLYNDQIAAIIREISCNAMDSHIEASKPDEPFNVWLPTEREPYFKVQDLGVGLTEEDIYNIYTVVGASTKENSNDLTGALGLGTKSPLFYSDAFTVETIKDGQYHIFTCFIKDGYPNVLKLESKETDAHNGVTVTVPVTDIEYFNETAGKIFRPFKVRPNILRNTLDYRLGEYDIAQQGKNWIRLANSDRTIVRYGNIEYPINMDMLKSANLKDNERKFISNGFVLDFPLGSLDIAPSREALNYDTRTVNNLCTIVEKVVEEFKESFIPKLSGILNLAPMARIFEMNKMYNSVKGSYSQKEFMLASMRNLIDIKERNDSSYVNVFEYNYLGNAYVSGNFVGYRKQSNGEVWRERFKMINPSDERMCFVELNPNINDTRFRRQVINHVRKTNDLYQVVIVEDISILEGIPSSRIIDNTTLIDPPTAKSAEIIGRYYLKEFDPKTGTMTHEPVSYNDIRDMKNVYVILEEPEYYRHLGDNMRQMIPSGFGKPFTRTRKARASNKAMISYFDYSEEKLIILKTCKFIDPSVPIVFISKAEKALKRSKTFIENNISLKDTIRKNQESFIAQNIDLIDAIKIVIQGKKSSSKYYRNESSSILPDIREAFFSNSLVLKRMTFFENLTENENARFKEAISTIQSDDRMNSLFFKYLLHWLPADIFFGEERPLEAKFPWNFSNDMDKLMKKFMGDDYNTNEHTIYRFNYSLIEIRKTIKKNKDKTSIKDLHRVLAVYENRNRDTYHRPRLLLERKIIMKLIEDSSILNTVMTKGVK